MHDRKLDVIQRNPFGPAPEAPGSNALTPKDAGTNTPNDASSQLSQSIRVTGRNNLFQARPAFALLWKESDGHKQGVAII
jgi:hypothetical protein